jgi:hypothetical protein
MLRLVAIFCVAIVGVLALGGCGGSGSSASKDQERNAKELRARVAHERAARLRAEKRRERASKRRAERLARQRQAASCGPGLVRSGGYCVVAPSNSGQPTTTPSAKAPSVDSAEGKQKLKTDSDCKGLPPPPPGYHGPVQC